MRLLQAGFLLFFPFLRPVNALRFNDFFSSLLFHSLSSRSSSYVLVLNHFERDSGLSTVALP